MFLHDLSLPLISEFDETGAYEELFPISADYGDGVDALMAALAKRMPKGPALYPPEQVADLPIRLLAAEITREKLMLRLHQELPYQLTVETESWEDKKDGSVRVQQVIIVARESHKPMVLGKGGSVVKAVGKAAREELSEMLDRPVHLFLFVKADERWQEKRERYEGLGLEFDV